MCLRECCGDGECSVEIWWEIKWLGTFERKLTKPLETSPSQPFLVLYDVLVYHTAGSLRDCYHPLIFSEARINPNASKTASRSFRLSSSMNVLILRSMKNRY